MPFETSMLRRLTFGLAVLSLLASAIVPSSASAATRLFAVANDEAEIWEVNPVTGAQIATFDLDPKQVPFRPGLAFNGTELFYTAINLPEITVYSTTGAVLRRLPKPSGAVGGGLGVSPAGLFYVAEDGLVTLIDPANGNVISSFTVTGARLGLTFAGSRGTLFALIDDTTTVQEIDATNGTVLNTLTNLPEIFRGLAFSSSNDVLYGARDGELFALNPNTGAVLPNYPVEMNGPSGRPSKTGALAADEIFVATCGDEQVNAAGETCDPPQSTQPNGNTCRTDCTYCGDANVDTGEQCDDGNTNDTDACRNDCTAPICGDGITDTNEQCDDGNTTNTDGCRNDCTLPRCGDGVLDAGEQCDDGNTDDADACRNTCRLPACGDAIVDPGEACDDGNANNGDTCRNDCTLPFCGDGLVDASEECDDGNTVPNDGCTSCTRDPFCGDGVLDPGEQCDDGNADDTDSCRNNCTRPLEICLDLIDNDLDGLIDCLDPECACLPIGRDPGAIRFGAPGEGDLFAVHGALEPATAIDPTTDQITLLLSNDSGPIYELVIAPGFVKKIGRNLYRFRNPLAKRNREGLARFDLRHFPQRDRWTFMVKSYGDLSLANQAKMSVQLAIDDDGFLNTSIWERLPRGWLLTLPKLP